MRKWTSLSWLFIFLFSLAFSAYAAAQEQRPVVVPSTPQRQDPDQRDSRQRPRAPARGEYVVEEGTALHIRLAESLSSQENESGDTFEAILDRDLLDERGRLVAPQGSRVEGRLVEVEDSGKVKGRARMRMELMRLFIDDDHEETLVTDFIEFQAEGTKGEDAKKVGIAAGIGAVIGAIAGGGKGAAIGAAIGGGAGGATVLLTKGDHVELRKERLLSFRLDRDLHVDLR